MSKKYDLNKTQLLHITRLCAREQGNVVGCRAEASLMANLFEKKGAAYGSGATGLYKYVRFSGWFSEAPKWMDNGECDKDEIDAVKDVFVNGNRFFPEYPVIDEHDCISDIEEVRNNGALVNKNVRANYIPNVSVISNCYESIYTFHSFPDGVNGYCDPFGYTEGSAPAQTIPVALVDMELNKGDTGYAVVVLQALLNIRMNGEIDCDGIFGEETRRLLRLYQAHKGLIVDEICGYNTWTSLIEG